MESEQGEPIERWTAKRRAALVLRLLKGETSVAEAARQPELTVNGFFRSGDFGEPVATTV